MMCLPGSVLAVLGDGQLGRMLAIEARRMGLVVWAVGSDATGPAAQLVDRHIRLPLTASAEIAEALIGAAVATFETEHVPLATLEAVAAKTPILPGVTFLAKVQDRLAQKQFLQGLGLPVAPFAAVNTQDDFAAAARELGFPFIVKTRRGGYDGKGQFKFHNAAELTASEGPFAQWIALGQPPSVAEGFVHFERELSVILARDKLGSTQIYPLAQNVHHNHVLRTTRVAPSLPNGVAAQAERLARAVAEASDYVGVLAVELFMAETGTLIINELAPRVHNSGHFTLGGAVTSQFEQHVRAVCGMPLGITGDPEPVAMANLLGDLWQNGAPDFAALLRRPNVQLHLYGKAAALPGRKMGHLLVRGRDAADAHEQAEACLVALERHASQRGRG
ncbi:MAG: 5-(carboxyamino)imidazole ribonucleotide synthase [Deltaproteobacteria bacterium]|nr:5-(carboxyamino)imidazole ribonucleotide synthase [Deltaproteobacteria bacterium]